MKLAAYVDESGRHDRTGKQKGSGQIIVAGWVDWRDNWTVFCCKWQSVLNKYNAQYFHFAEWAEASRVVRKKHKPSSSFSKNPYQGWDLKKLDNFLYELAELAGAGEKVFVGGFILTKDFAEAKKHPDYSKFAPSHGDPYRACLDQFFDHFSTEVQQQWPYWNEPVTFFFDQNRDDAEWSRAVQDAYTVAKGTDSRIAELVFADKKLCPQLPLQAADMLAYRMRQIAEKFTDPAIIPNPSKLDDYLIKPMFLRANPPYLKGMLGELSSTLSLRYSNYPWRKKS